MEEAPVYFPELVLPICQAVSIEQVRSATDRAGAAILKMKPHEIMQFCADCYASMPHEKALFVLGRVCSVVEDLCNKYETS